MTSNFVLGIGGTGAKCVEAFVHLASCGIGPANSWVGLLEQDRSNGNAARAIRTLSDYLTLRTALRAFGSADLGSSPLLATAIEQPKTGWAWAPDEKSSNSLSVSIGYPGLPASEQALVQALFSKEERQLTLDEGFRQRPALGAALTLQGVTPTSSVWRDLLGALQTAGQGEEVRVFLVASIFGGTGAAGFPTVARLLRAEIKRRNLTGQVKLGGALLLPYFSFPPPPPSLEGGQNITPDSGTFMMQARGALEYYSALFQSEQIFEKLYVVGSDPLIPLRMYSEGGPNQANPPLLPELVAALAAIDFVDTRSPTDGQIVAAGTNDVPSIGWEDLPFNGDGGAPALRIKVAAALRTAVAWRQAYAPALARESWAAASREMWARRLLDRDGDEPVIADRSQRAISLTTAAFDRLLRWFVALNRGGAGGVRRLALIDDGLIARDWPSAAVEDVQLASRLSNHAFSRLVPPRSGPSLKSIFSDVTYAPAPTSGAGIGRALAALHAACQDTHRRET